MESCWIINYQNGNRILINEKAYNTEAYKSVVKAHEVRSEEHWFSLEECINDNPKIEKIFL